MRVSNQLIIQRAPSTRRLDPPARLTPKERGRSLSLPALPEPADLPEVGEHLAAGHVFQHHVEVRVVLWGKKATLQTKWTEQRLRKKRKMAPTIGWWR